MRRAAASLATALAAALMPALVAVSTNAPPAWSQAAAAADPDPRERLTRLKHQLELYREIRAKHQRDDFFRVSREDAVRLEEMGLEELRKFEVAKSLFGMLEAGPDVMRLRMERSLGVDKLPPAPAAAARDAIKTYIDQRQGGELIKYGGLGKDVLEVSGRLIDRRPSTPAEELRFNDAVTAVTTFEATFKNGTFLLSKVPGGTLASGKMADQAAVVAEILGTSTRGLLYTLKMQAATTPKAREEARAEALKEVAGLVAAGVKVTEREAALALSTQAKLVAINVDVWSRLGYWWMARSAASGLRHQASEIQSAAINQLNYQIMVTQYEIDKAERAVRIAERKAARPLREPGGIKLNNIAADAIAARLDISAVAFDAVSGKIVIEGKQSRNEFDLAVFQTVLRLAAEEHEPFFSLNAVNDVDFDAILTDLSRRIHYKYQRGGNAPLARRLVETGLRIPSKDGRECYFADLARVDPALSQAARSGYDDREEMVYSPEWLRYTKVGRVLYEADTHIKSIVTGFRVIDGKLMIADVWDIPGFQPKFLTATIGAGRANLELDASEVMATPGRVDLSAVKPKLVYVARKPGTSEDLPPTPEHSRIVEHFDRNWQAYVDRVPPLAELMTVYRAYVAARFLVARQPRLKQQILDLGVPTATDVWPLYTAGTMSVAGCVANGRLTPLDGSGRVLSYGGALSGGTSFKLDRKIKYVADDRPAESLTFPMAEMRGKSGVVERDGRTALILDYDEPTLPLDRQWRMFGLCLAAALAAAGLLFGIRRIWPPAPPSQPLCLHCIALHRRLETTAAATDVVAAAALAFVAILPYLAAANVDVPSWLQAAAATSVVAGTMTAAASLGFLVHLAAAKWRQAPQPMIGPARWLGAGCRWIGLALAAVLLSNGASTTSIAERLVEFDLGTGSRLVGAIGDLSVLRTALLVLIACALGSVALRWVIPYLRHSRPLLLGLHLHDMETVK